jgi:hypothetical protein
MSLGRHLFITFVVGKSGTGAYHIAARVENAVHAACAFSEAQTKNKELQGGSLACRRPVYR